MKKIITVVSIITLGSGAVGCNKAPSAEELHEKFMEEVKAYVNSTNATLPKEISPTMNIEKMTLLGNTISLQYKNIKFTAGEININIDRAEIRKTFIKAGCKNQTARNFLDNNINYKHIFYDKNNIFTASFEVTKEDCYKY